MKPLVLETAVMLSALFLTSCSVGDSWEDDNNNNSAYSDDGSASASVSNDSLNFTVSLDAGDASLYGVTAETVTADADFVENSSFTTTVTVVYDGSEVSVSGYPADSVSVSVSGAHVVVTSKARCAEYILTGSTSDGQFKLYSDYKSKITLSGVSITNATGSAINNQSDKRTFIVVADGTSNSLRDGASYSTVSGEDEKGCLFSEGQLCFSGGGTLNVTGSYNHGIVSDDYIRLSGAQQIYVTAAGDGMHANDSIIIAGGLLSVESWGEGVQSEGGILMTGGFAKAVTTGEKSHAFKADTNIGISGGALQASVGGTASKGLKSDIDINISGGKLTLMTTGGGCYDSDEKDASAAAGMKAGEDVAVTGGVIRCQSTGAGGKGISADGAYRQTGGNVKIITTGKKYTYSSSATSSPKGIKADGDITVTGGVTIVKATGGEGSEGIESKSGITVAGGVIIGSCYDDCINAASSLTESGGAILAISTGNDGIDSNGTLSVSGGTMIGLGTTSPEEGIDIIENGTISISGGTVLGMGGGQSAAKGQAMISVSGVTVSSGVTLAFATSGDTIFSLDMPRAYSNATLFFSSSALTSGGSCTVTAGGSTIATATAVTSVSDSQGGGGGGGGGPQWR